MCMKRLWIALAVFAGVVSFCGRMAGAVSPEPATRPAIGAPVTPVVGVIELFTSQGCAYCPPADALLQKYASRPDIIALSLPVDYWDYTGWKDTFANPKHTDRQRAYAKARGDGAMYTPQAIVNGIKHVNGASAVEIDAALTETRPIIASEQVPVQFRQERNILIIETGGALPNHLVKEATIWLAVVQAKGDAAITAGENTGKTLTYTNIVREMTPVGLWKGDPLKIMLPRQAVMLPETQKSVVLVQQGRAGPIVGAAWISLF